MIMIERPGKFVGGYRRCGCNGKCPYGFPESSCPGSTAMAWQVFIPDPTVPEGEMWVVDKDTKRVASKVINIAAAMRAGDV